MRLMRERPGGHSCSLRQFQGQPGAPSSRIQTAYPNRFVASRTSVLEHGDRAATSRDGCRDVDYRYDVLRLYLAAAASGSVPYFDYRRVPRRDRPSHAS